MARRCATVVVALVFASCLELDEKVQKPEDSGPGNTADSTGGSNETETDIPKTPTDTTTNEPSVQTDTETSISSEESSSSPTTDTGQPMETEASDTAITTPTDTTREAQEGTDTASIEDTQTSTPPEKSCAAHFGVLDETTNLCWQNPIAGTFTWQGGVDYCENLVLGDLNAWTLPTLEDVAHILNCSSAITPGEDVNCAPCNESPLCSSLFGPDENWYWTATQLKDGQAWLAVFDTGLLTTSETSDSYEDYVRCVHRM